MKVLSMFDGISVGRLALHNSNVAVDEYHAFEIDSNAIAITRYRWPEVIQRGNIEDIDYSEFAGFDLLLCGSPCQDLSGFNNDGAGLAGIRSKLFWYGAKAVQLGLCKYFLFENVANMKNSDRDVMSEALGVAPLKICSSTVSAQTRGRYYWTNLPYTCIGSPDKAENILESGIAARNTYTAVLTSYDSVNDKRFYSGFSTHYAFSPNPEGAFLYDSTRLVKNAAKPINLVDGMRYDMRRLDAVEFERLQTLPDDYTRYGIRLGKKQDRFVEIGYHARHHAVGNAWTSKIIEGFLTTL